MLDTKTLFINFTLITVFLSCAMFFFWYVQKTYEGFTEWVITAFLAAACYVLILLRGVIPDFISIPIANAGLPAALILRLHGTRKFFSRNSVSPFYLLIPSVLLIIYSYFTYAVNNIQIRTFYLTLSITFMTTVLAWEFYINRNRGSRLLNTTISTLNLVYGFLFLLRGLILIKTPGYKFLNNATFDNFFFIIAPLFEISWNVFFMMLNSKRTEEELKDALVLAEDANRAKTRFLGIMSHEMRTPLHSIRGTSEMLKGHLADEKASRYLNLLDRSSFVLQRLIDDALDMTLIESGKLALRNEPVYLEELMDDLEKLFEMQFVEKGLEFKTNIEKGVPATFITDGHRLIQILSNLTCNAVKNTTKGTVEINARFAGDRANPAILFSVADTGKGIPSESIEKIFEPFSSFSSDKIKSTGLGLAIVKSLCELMGGSVIVETDLGRGSVFTVTIPYLKADDEKHDMILVQSSEPDLPPLFMLAVDDVPENLELLNSYFEGTDVAIADAISGSDAMDKLSLWHFDCMLLDIQLPDISGIEVVKWLRENEAELGIERMPVIAISANAYEHDRKEAIDAGCDAYLARPAGKHKLFEAILRIVRNDVTIKSDNKAPGLLDKLPEDLAVKALSRIVSLAEETLKACEIKDAKTAGRLGHSIKGLGKTFRNLKAAEIGEEIELAAEGDDFDKIIRMVQMLLL
jgi:signal transduction histidine kinase/CheY-like chemotaxis protein